jgi:hypothetical protein
LETATLPIELLTYYLGESIIDNADLEPVNSGLTFASGEIKAAGLIKALRLD